MKPMRMKTTYLLYTTTLLGYFAGRTVFGMIAPVQQPKQPKQTKLPKH